MIVDIAVVLVLVLAGYVGARRGVMFQASLSIGSLLGLSVSAFLYERVAFLGTGSDVRLVILIMLTLATILFCYSLTFIAVAWLRRFVDHKLRRRKLLDKTLGGAVGVLLWGLSFWALVSIFTPVMPPAVARQLAHSVVVTTANRFVSIPPVFRNVSQLLDPFAPPAAFASSSPDFSTGNKAAWSQNLSTVANTAQASMVEVDAWGCGSESVGSGFWVGPHFVLTNAHVVAGAYRLSVQNDQGVYTAQLVGFDPRTDYAVLMTQSDASGAPLPFQTSLLSPGEPAVTLGYPGGEKLTENSVSVIRNLRARGYDIYGQSEVDRSVYVLQASIVPGDSGGPLITAQGKVAGLVFGNSTTQPDVGYAVTASQFALGVQRAMAKGQVVESGACTSD